MTVLDKITLTKRLAWAIEGAGAGLGTSGVRLDDWVSIAANARGIDVMDVLQPFIEARTIVSGKA